MAKINEMFRKDLCGYHIRREIDPAKRAEGIKRVVAIFNKLRDEYRRNHPSSETGPDEQTACGDIRPCPDVDNRRVQPQGLGQFDNPETAESDRNRDFKGTFERVFLRRVPDGKQQDPEQGQC